MAKFTSFLNSVKNFLCGLKDKVYEGYKWLGNDGIINLESSALIVIILMLFFPIFWSAIFTFIIMVSKCALDKSKGREDEKHDLVCAVIGILFGVILGSAQAVVFLM